MPFCHPRTPAAGTAAGVERDGLAAVESGLAEEAFAGLPRFRFIEGPGLRVSRPMTTIPPSTRPAATRIVVMFRAEASPFFGTPGGDFAATFSAAGGFVGDA